MTHDDRKPPTWDDQTRYNNPVAEEPEALSTDETSTAPPPNIRQEGTTMSPTTETPPTERRVRLLLRHARIQTFVLGFGLLGLLVVSVAGFLYENSGIGRDIDASPTISGNGSAHCTFTNRGWAPGADCFRVGVEVKALGMVRGEHVVCSGKLYPKESKTITMSILEGSTRPTDWCTGGWGDSGGTSWLDYCDVWIERIADEP